MKRAALEAGFLCAAMLIFGKARTNAQSANQSAQQGSTAANSSAPAGPIVPRATKGANTKPTGKELQKADAAAQTNGTPGTNANSTKYIEVPTGTVLPLVLHNAISTRSARPGDPVFLQTVFPILIGGKIVIPAGSYVSGEVTEAKRAGRIHGKAEIRIRLDNLILPNGYEARFDAAPRDAGTGGNETVGKEGTIHGDSNKAGDVDTVAQDTVAGAGIGTAVGAAAGHIGEGAGLGVGAGAAAGLLTVLLTRGPEAELPRGSTLDVSLNRPLYLQAAKINFTSPGQAPMLAGPPNREPRRTTGIIPHR